MLPLYKLCVYLVIILGTHLNLDIGGNVGVECAPTKRSSSWQNYNGGEYSSEEYDEDDDDDDDGYDDDDDEEEDDDSHEMSNHRGGGYGDDEDDDSHEMNSQEDGGYIHSGSSIHQNHIYGQANPTYGQAYPTYGQMYPTHGQTYPTYGQAYPTYGQAYPSNGQVNPTYGQTYPNYLQNYPTYGQTFPSTGTGYVYPPAGTGYVYPNTINSNNFPAQYYNPVANTNTIPLAQPQPVVPNPIIRQGEATIQSIAAGQPQATDNLNSGFYQRNPIFDPTFGTNPQANTAAALQSRSGNFENLKQLFQIDNENPGYVSLRDNP